MPEADPRSDQALVDAANRGDPGAFEALYVRHRDWVAGLAFRFTGSREDALDILQETFAHLLKKFPGFRLTANMKTYLYPVVKNLAITGRRRRGRYVQDDEAVGLVAAPEDPGTGTEDLVRVLGRLTDAHREVVLLRYVDDLSLEEIAEAVGVPVGTVKSRLHHALGALREDPQTRKYFAP